MSDDDAMQGMLFGVVDADLSESEQGAADQLRICALNVNSPNLARSQRTVNWLLATKANTLVLTEMQPSDGGRHILGCLQAEGFTTTCTPGWKDSRYFTAVATRGIEVTSPRPVAFDPRVAVADLVVDGAVVRVVGVYGPTNGMTAESSLRRREFQSRFMSYLAEVDHAALCVMGDLNVVERDHEPRLPAFEDHDHAFYEGLLGFGLLDAYRELNPARGDHSWISPRFGAQRLDHSMVSAGAGKVESCAYDHATRSDGLSDHAAMLTVIMPNRGR